MSRSGNPYDNAACESFMKTLKYEEVYRQEYRDLAEARASIERFIEKIYNGKRLHSALGYRPPVEFERSLLIPPLPAAPRMQHDCNEKRGRPQNAFSQAWRNLSVRCVITSCKPGPEFRFPVGPGQAIGRAGRNTPCPSSAMSSGRLFLDGLLASIARLRFTGSTRLNRLPASKEMIYHRTVNSLLTVCLTERDKFIY